MLHRKKFIMYAAAVMTIQLGLMPEGTLAFRAPDQPRNIMSAVEENSNQPLQLKKVSSRNLKQKSIIINEVQGAVTLAENMMNLGSDQAIAVAAGLASEDSSTGGSVASLTKAQTDHLGFQHIRIAQNYKGLPVVGSEVIVHLDGQGRVYMLNGQYQEDKEIDIEPAITAEDALAIGIGDEEQTGDNGLQVVLQPELVIYNGQLAWHYIVKQSGEHPGQWYYYVNAHSGIIINHYNNIKYSFPHAGISAVVTGNRLSGEDGSLVSIDGYWSAFGNGNYYLYSFDNLWGVYDLDIADWEQQATSAWGMNDPAAVSAAYNFEAVQNYVSTTLGRNSFDDAGATAQANVHEGTNYVNAYWDGSDFHFGDGDGP